MKVQGMGLRVYHIIIVENGTEDEIQTRMK